ncbi:MAG TPA: hypothetical protein VJB60_02895 [Candidatus Peribacterales bacterium]|nr:hypothetical protein [Candidatus Peribacterales bacterium]
MYLTYTRHRVQDYEHWRKAFDANVPMLENAGVIGTWVVQINDDPTDIAVINTWPGKENWDNFIASHKFKNKDEMVQAQEKAGVIGEPEWWVGEVV